MYNEISVGEQRCKVLSIAKRGMDRTAGKSLGSANHAIDRVRVMHRYAGARGSNERRRRLAGAAATQDDYVATTQAPSRNGWRLEVA
jgi:hypothetical protein